MNVSDAEDVGATVEAAEAGPGEGEQLELGHRVGSPRMEDAARGDGILSGRKKHTDYPYRPPRVDGEAYQAVVPPLSSMLDKSHAGARPLSGTAGAPGGPAHSIGPNLALRTRRDHARDHCRARGSGAGPFQGRARVARSQARQRPPQCVPCRARRTEPPPTSTLNHATPTQRTTGSPSCGTRRSGSGPCTTRRTRRRPPLWGRGAWKRTSSRCSGSRPTAATLGGRGRC